MNITIKDIMSTDVLTLSPDDPVEKALELMIERSVRNRPVVDVEGRLPCGTCEPNDCACTNVPI